MSTPPPKGSVVTCTECDLPPHTRGMCESHYKSQLARHKRIFGGTEIEFRISELEHLLDGGVWPPDAVRRLGWTIKSAEDAARYRGMTRLTARLAEYRRGAEA